MGVPLLLAHSLRWSHCWLLSCWPALPPMDCAAACRLETGVLDVAAALDTFGVLLALLLDLAAEADLTAAAALCSCCSLKGPWLRSDAALLLWLAGVAVSLL
jgi:hypothetical protein